jgi:DNA-binding NtrC family response regulator
VKVSARVLAASNRDLEKAVAEGKLREDLFYRLGQVLRVPPLRERVEDIPPLVNHFCERAGVETEVTPEAMAALCAHHWPGNVRELESVVRKLITFCGRHVLAEDVERHLGPPARDVSLLPELSLMSLMNGAPNRRWPTVSEMRRRYVAEAFRYFGRESAVARALGIDYRTVSALIKQDSDDRPPAVPQA